MAVQYVADLQTGDAVSDIARSFDRLMRRWGWDASIAAAGWSPELRDAARAYQEVDAPDGSLHVYHFSVACSPLTAHFRRQRGRRIVVYHNITPPEWFLGYDEHALWSTGLGRSELASMRHDVDFAASYSRFNVAELQALGFEPVVKIPFVLDFSRFDVEPDAEVLKGLQDGATHLLFVGRVAPNKCHEDVVRTFYHYHRHVNRNSTLHLVGPLGIASYVERLRGLIDGLGLTENVALPGKVSDAAVAAYYRGAHVFVCMSEHEGFCVPLLEAMHYGVPVVAFAAGAVPDTMGDAGLLVREKRFDAVAEMIHLLTTDDVLRAQVVERQKEHLQSFEEKAAEAGLRAALS